MVPNECGEDVYNKLMNDLKRVKTVKEEKSEERGTVTHLVLSDPHCS